MKICQFIFLLFLAGSYTGFSQTKIIDNLKQAIRKTQPDDKKLQAILDLCEQGYSLHPDTLMAYAKKAREIAQEQHNLHGDLAGMYYEAFALTNKGLVDSSLNIANHCLQVLSGKIKDPVLEANILNQKGRCYMRKNQYKEAIEMGYRVITEAEKSGDILLQMKGKTLIGWAYLEMGQSNEALSWHLKALKTTRDTLLLEQYGILFANLALNYNSLGKMDSGHYYIKRAINYSRRNENLFALSNALAIQARLYVTSGKSKQAEAPLKEVVTIRKLIGDPFYIVSDMGQLGLYYAHNKQADKGIAICNEGIAVARQYKLDTKLFFLYSVLAENYKAQDNTGKYAEVLEQIISLKDSVYQKNSAEALAQMQTKYEVQKKENIIIRQEYALTKKNYFMSGVIALLAATLLFGYFFFQNKRKTEQLKIRAIELEQKKKTTQAVIQAEEEERKRIAGDLHDSVAQKMVVAKLNLEAVGNHLKHMEESQQKIFDNIRLLLDESTTEVRNLSHSMMPQAFSRSGLATAVKDFLDKIEQPQLKINFSAEGDFSAFKENIALMIYRIIQECVQNILKHARATRLDLAMIAGDNEADVTIEDNGIGFDLGKANLAESQGIRNIRSRIEYLSGKLDINTQPGNGTVIAFYIPLHHS
ncbi:MAG TPA: sensor histidine kinase [Chitinophagaceae bacterium]|jgi:signal transduction histidine kinase